MNTVNAKPLEEVAAKLQRVIDDLSVSHGLEVWIINPTIELLKSARASTIRAGQLLAQMERERHGP